MHLETTALTPRVTLDPAEHRLVLEGDCYPEDPAAFFGPMLEALREYLAGDVGERLSVVLRLCYVNSSSAKALRRLLVTLDGAAAQGRPIHVCWDHEADDEVGEELGRDLTDELYHLDVTLRPCSSAA